MSVVKVYEKEGRVYVILPGDVQFVFEQDGDIEAINGTASDEVTLRYVQNQELFIHDLSYLNFYQANGIALIAGSRHLLVAALNDLFNAPPKLRDHLDVNGKNITSSSNGDVTLDPDGTGSIILKSDDIQFQAAAAAFTSGTIRLYESSILTPQHYIAIASPASVTADTTLTLPDGAGSNGQALKTDGSGTLSWGNVLGDTAVTLFGVTSLKHVGTSDATLAFYDQNASNFVALTVPSDIASDVTFQLPVADGTSGQVLKTDGSGVLSFVDQSSGGGSSSDGWHGHTTKIKVMPSEFVGNDVGRTVTQVRIEDDTSNRLGAAISQSTGSCFAFVPIPTGYKATALRVNASSTVTNAVTASHYAITTGTVSNSQTFNTNVHTSLSVQLTSSDTTVLVIEVTPANTAVLIYGASVTIATV